MIRWFGYSLFLVSLTFSPTLVQAQDLLNMFGGGQNAHSSGLIFRSTGQDLLKRLKNKAQKISKEITKWEKKERENKHQSQRAIKRYRALILKHRLKYRKKWRRKEREERAIHKEIIKIAKRNISQQMRLQTLYLSHRQSLVNLHSALLEAIRIRKSLKRWIKNYIEKKRYNALKQDRQALKKRYEAALAKQKASQKRLDDLKKRLKSDQKLLQKTQEKLLLLEDDSLEEAKRLEEEKRKAEEKKAEEKRKAELKKLEEAKAAKKRRRRRRRRRRRKKLKKGPTPQEIAAAQRALKRKMERLQKIREHQQLIRDLRSQQYKLQFEYLQARVKWLSLRQEDESLKLQTISISLQTQRHVLKAMDDALIKLSSLAEGGIWYQKPLRFDQKLFELTKQRTTTILAQGPDQLLNILQDLIKTLRQKTGWLFYTELSLLLLILLFSAIILKLYLNKLIKKLLSENQPSFLEHKEKNPTKITNTSSEIQTADPPPNTISQPLESEEEKTHNSTSEPPKKDETQENSTPSPLHQAENDDETKNDDEDDDEMEFDQATLLSSDDLKAILSPQKQEPSSESPFNSLDSTIKDKDDDNEDDDEMLFDLPLQKEPPPPPFDSSSRAPSPPPIAPENAFAPPIELELPEELELSDAGLLIEAPNDVTASSERILLDPDLTPNDNSSKETLSNLENNLSRTLHKPLLFIFQVLADLILPIWLLLLLGVIAWFINLPHKWNVMLLTLGAMIPLLRLIWTTTHLLFATRSDERFITSIDDKIAKRFRRIFRVFATFSCLYLPSFQFLSLLDYPKDFLQLYRAGFYAILLIGLLLLMLNKRGILSLLPEQPPLIAALKTFLDRAYSLLFFIALGIFGIYVWGYINFASYLTRGFAYSALLLMVSYGAYKLLLFLLLFLLNTFQQKIQKSPSSQQQRSSTTPQKGFLKGTSIAHLKTLVGLIISFITLSLLLEIWGVQGGYRTLLKPFNTPFVSIKDTQITLLSIFKLIFAIGLGRFLVSFSKQKMESTLYPMFEISLANQHAINTVISYTLSIISLLIGLQWMGVGIGVLAVFAGVIGIGVGFGIQNIANNFISGLLITFGKPIKNGDLIELDGIAGLVKKISTRSTTIETFDGRNILVPNADLLTEKVINWTHGSPFVRASMEISVKHGSEAIHVRETLLLVAKRHPKVLKEPPPFVLFKAFSSQSLDFVLWIAVRDPLERDMVLSDLNFDLHYNAKALGLDIIGTQTAREECSNDNDDDDDEGKSIFDED